MAAHIFNCTIDAPDLTPPDEPEDLSYNEMETITEFIAEKILGIENAFPEREDADAADQSFFKAKVSLDPFESSPKHGGFVKRGDIFFKPNQVDISADEFCNQYIGRPTSPPPWRG